MKGLTKYLVSGVIGLGIGIAGTLGFREYEQNRTINALNQLDKENPIVAKEYAKEILKTDCNGIFKEFKEYAYKQPAKDYLESH
jgi:hypothetical protein